MIGLKKSLKPIKEFLLKNGITNYVQTEFYQGNTTRWAIAWTFLQFIDLSQLVIHSKKHTTGVQSFMKDITCCANIDEMIEKIQNILQELQVINFVICSLSHNVNITFLSGYLSLLFFFFFEISQSKKFQN